MRRPQRDILRKKRLLEHAERIGNIHKAYRYYGVSRSAFYLCKKACETYGEEGLVNKKPGPVNLKLRTPPEIVEKIIAKEKPDSLLPTLGGQTGLNTAVALAESGVLKKHKVRMLGANLRSIKKAEERDRFKQTMTECGLEVPRSGYAHTWEEAKKIIDYIGYPAIIRPSYTLGGKAAT